MTTIVDHRDLEANSDINWGKIALTAVLAGAVSLTAWEIWAKVITPFWAGGALSPIGLVKSALGINKGTVGAFLNASPNATSNAIANGLHLLTGLLIYPLAYIFAARPIARIIGERIGGVLGAISSHWVTIGTVYGVALWVFALYIMAHLAAGFAPFLGFSNLAWASLVGHVLVGLAIAGTVHRSDT